MTFDRAWEEGHRKHAWARWPDTRFVEFAMRRFGDRRRSGVRFLELGCGGGAQVAFLAAEGFDVLGIDASDAAVIKARRLLHERLPHHGDHNIFPRAFKADICTVDFAPHQFDCIFDVCTLQHLPPERASEVLASVWRWIKADGVFWSKWANYLSEVPADTPQPNLISAHDIPRLFHEGWRTTVGSEQIWMLDARARDHLIIQAEPVKSSTQPRIAA